MKGIIILLNKILYKIGKCFHRGSSIPGQMALLLDKNILQKLKLPKEMIVVTGSNGKTSTTEMIANIFIRNGYRVGWNYEGSNQIEGITTMILNACNLKGEVQKDVLIMESDERYLRFLTKQITPTYLVVTNLFRDQMTRNGHPEWIFEKMKEGIPQETHLVLNADEPLSALLGWKKENVTYVGMERQEDDRLINDTVYDDGKYCPNCHHVMQYEYYHFAHVGKYHCESCGYQRPMPEFAITQMDLTKGCMTINHKQKLQMSFKSKYHAYNLLFAFAVAKLQGIEEEKIVSVLQEYMMQNDRIQTFHIDDKEGMLLTSKHENSISYNQSIDYVVEQAKTCTVVIIVDAISRKYFTSETSWLWDIDFEKLNADCVKEIVLAGKYVYDLCIRFQYAQIPEEKICYTQDLEEMMHMLKECKTNQIYAITCFSDRMKLMKRV